MDSRTLATVISVLGLVLMSAGCIDPYPGDGDNFPPEFTIQAHPGDCYMVDVGVYDAIVFITTNSPRERSDYTLPDIFLDGGLRKGDGNLGPSYQFNDTYGDGILNTGDIIELFNLRAQHLTTYNITLRGETLANFTLEFNYGDLGAFLITVYNPPTKLVGDGLYRVVNPVGEVRNPTLLRFDDLDISYVSEHGYLLNPVDILYSDVDGNGFISVGDTMEVTNLTIEYEDGQIFYKVAGVLVGRSLLGDFNN